MIPKPDVSCRLTYLLFMLMLILPFIIFPFFFYFFFCLYQPSVDFISTVYDFMALWGIFYYGWKGGGPELGELSCSTYLIF